jgi:DNA-binding transcriptional LysR family regulator
MWPGGKDSLGMDILTDLRTFARVAEKGSFSAVARESGSTQPAISRQIAALEEFYGVRLFHRSTRKLALTEEGRAFQPHVEAVLSALEAAQEALHPQAGDIAGLVRIGATAGVGVALGAGAYKLLQRHKLLSIEIVVAEGPRDMIAEGLDLMVAVGALPDTAQVSRQIGDNRPMLVASPAYLERAGEPATPADLQNHVCVTYPGEGETNIWHFTGPEGEVAVSVQSRIRSNSTAVILRAVRDGCGIALLPLVTVSNSLERGALRRVLPAYAPARYPIQVLYPSRRNLPARTRAVIDFLIRELELEPALVSHALVSDHARLT